MAIGAMSYGLKPVEICAAYVTFGNHGLYYKPWSYYKVTNSAGTEVILEPNRVGEQVISQGTADVMRHLLECVVTYSSGTGYRFGIRGQKSFSKSGTTSDNCDKWIVGGTPYYICCSWTGFEELRPINTNYYGSNPAGTVYQYVMNKIHADLDYLEFEDTEDCIQRSYCVGTGKLAGSGCTRAVGYYKADNLPGICNCGGTTGKQTGGEEETGEEDTSENAETTPATEPTQPPTEAHTDPPATEPPPEEPFFD